jgi:hypothetical protein
VKPFLSITLTALAAGCLGACSTASSSSVSDGLHAAPVKEPPVTLAELASLRRQPDVKFETVRVSMQVAPGPKAPPLLLADITALRGRRVQVAQVTKFPFPSDFNFPKSTDGSPNPVTPVTPREFTSRNTGITVSFTATSRGPFIMLDGTVTDSQCERLARNPGRVFGPVYTDDKKVMLTEKKCLSPQFTDRITHFHVAALPDQPLSLPMNTGGPGASLLITASLPAAPKHAIAGSRKSGRGRETGVIVASGG